MHVAGIENVDSFEPQLQSFHHVSSGGCSQPEAYQSRPICKQGPFFYNFYAKNCIEIEFFFSLYSSDIQSTHLFSPTQSHSSQLEQQSVRNLSSDARKR